MRHVVNAVKGGDEVDRSVARQRFVARIDETGVWNPRLSAPRFGAVECVLADVIADKTKKSTFNSNYHRKLKPHAS
jgi:hypothetical protein